MAAAWKSRGLVVEFIRPAIGNLLKISSLLLIRFIEEQAAEAVAVFLLIRNIIYTWTDNILVGLTIPGSVPAGAEKVSMPVIGGLESLFNMIKKLRILIDSPILFICNPENKPVYVIQ